MRSGAHKLRYMERINYAVMRNGHGFKTNYMEKIKDYYTGFTDALWPD